MSLFPMQRPFYNKHREEKELQIKKEVKSNIKAACESYMPKTVPKHMSTRL